MRWKGPVHLGNHGESQRMEPGNWMGAVPIRCVKGVVFSTMTISNTLYEVETRFHFNDRDEAFRMVPLLQSCLKNEIEWKTTHYGVDLFKSDRILRISEVNFKNGLRYYLGWKGPDTGQFANIREEIDEEITAGIVNSAILTFLGGQNSVTAPNEVEKELERLGYEQFMTFTGKNLLGLYEPLGLHLKLILLSRPYLGWPLLLEIEKTARTHEEASEVEAHLRDFTKEFNLQRRIVREEPPSMLYSVVR